MHLAREPQALGDRSRLGHESHVDLVALDLVARQAAAVHPALAALLPAGPEVIDAAVEGQVFAEPAPPAVQEAGQPAPVVAVAVGEGERVDRRRIEGQLAEVVVHRVGGEPEVEGHREPVAGPGHLDQVGQPVLGPKIRHLAGHEGAVAAGNRVVLAEVIDVVVHDSRDADPIDGGRHARILPAERVPWLRAAGRGAGAPPAEARL